MKGIVKSAVLAATFSMAFVLVACGGLGSSGSASASASASASSASVATSASAAANTSASTSSASASATELDIGVVSGDTYSNEVFGVKYVLPAGYAFLDEARIAELNKTVGDLSNSELVAEALRSGTAVIAMAAESNGGNGDNVNVSIAYSDTPAASAIDAAAYAEYAKELVPAQLEQAGATVKSVESGTYRNPTTGEEYASLKATLQIDGEDRCQDQVYVVKDGYLLTVTSTASTPEETEALLATLSKL